MVSLRYWFTFLALAAVSWGCADNSIPELPPLPQYVTTFGDWGRDPGEFDHPVAIAIGPDSLLYITDTGNDRIQVLTRQGTFVRQWPINRYTLMITVAPDSSVYADDRNRWGGITRFTKDGQFIEGLNLVNRLEGFEVDASGNLYICGLRVYSPDPFHTYEEGPYVWKFNPQHELIKKWGYPGPADTTGWSGGPMTWSPSGNLVMMGEIDSSTAVFEFTPDGNTVSSWRAPNIEFQSSDLAYDTKGRILISSPYSHRIYVFDAHGTPLVDFVDVSKNEEPLDMPAGITVDPSGFIYVVDYGRNRIIKYREAR